MEWYLIYFDLITTEILHYFGNNLSSNLINAQIIGGRFYNLETIILVKGTEIVLEYEFSANEIFYLNMLQPEEINIIHIWDLKYMEDITSNIRSASNPIFLGKINGISSVFYCKYDYVNMIIKNHITQYFIENSTDPVQLEVNDVLSTSQSLFFFRQK